MITLSEETGRVMVVHNHRANCLKRLILVELQLVAALAMVAAACRCGAFPNPISISG